MVVIVDYHMGNLGSLQNMLNILGVKNIISSDIDIIVKAEKLVLPGVGAFDKAMSNIRQMQLEYVLNKKVVDQKTPILGICLGMQLFANWSEEGNQKGLSVVPPKVKTRKFDS